MFKKLVSSVSVTEGNLVVSWYINDNAAYSPWKEDTQGKGNRQIWVSCAGSLKKPVAEIKLQIKVSKSYTLLYKMRH